jgi:hypothetical protein
MQILRRWATRHASLLAAVYRGVERAIIALAPAWRLIGAKRSDRLVAALERLVKRPLFDCRMCGHCILGATGMTCPMNCPKNLRNGPCGGVRADGGCEVAPAMRCVWVEAWEGSRRLPGGAAEMSAIQPPLDRRGVGRSSWLREAGEKRGLRDAV